MRGVLLEAAAKLPRILARSAPQLPRTESDDDVIRSPGPGHLNPTPDSAVSQRIRRILITMHPEIPTLYLLVLFDLHHHFFKSYNRLYLLPHTT